MNIKDKIFEALVCLMVLLTCAGCSASGGLSGTYYKADLFNGGEIEDEGKWLKFSGNKVTWHRGDDDDQEDVYTYSLETDEDGDVKMIITDSDGDEESCSFYTREDNPKLIYFPGCFNGNSYAKK